MPLIPKGQEEAERIETFLGCKTGVLLSKDSPVSKEEIIAFDDALQHGFATFAKNKMKSTLHCGANFLVASGALIANAIGASSMPVNLVFGGVVAVNYFVTKANIGSLDRINAYNQQAIRYFSSQLPRDFFLK